MTGGLLVGMVNRIGFDRNHQLSKDEWGKKVQTELEKKPVFKINLSSDFTSISGNIAVEVESLNRFKQLIQHCCMPYRK